MRKLPLAFFTAAALFVLTGMGWGIKMAASQDFAMAPAHAHLNLVGWATMGLMGTFYAISGQGGRLGWVNFFLSAAAVVVMVPSLAILLGGNPQAEAVVAVGSILAVLGMLTFIGSILRAWRKAA